MGWPAATTAVNWSRRLAHIPSWALATELSRRDAGADRDATVGLPGLRVDPFASLVVWRGDEYVISGRQLEVIYALALARQQGRRRLTAVQLGQMVWRGWGAAEGARVTHVYVCYLRRRFPGLIETAKSRTTGVAYGLVLDDAPVVVDVA